MENSTSAAAEQRSIHTRDELTDKLLGRIGEFIHELNHCIVPYEAVHT